MTFITRELHPQKQVYPKINSSILLLLGLLIYMFFCLKPASAKGIFTLSHPEIKLKLPGSVDYDKLAYAISCAETSCGKDGTAIHRANCCGIMMWNEAGRHPKYFTHYQDSLKETAKIWQQYYVRFPDQALATKWTGNDHPDRWLAVVRSKYYND